MKYHHASGLKNTIFERLKNIIYSPKLFITLIKIYKLILGFSILLIGSSILVFVLLFLNKYLKILPSSSINFFVKLFIILFYASSYGIVFAIIFRTLTIDFLYSDQIKVILHLKYVKNHIRNIQEKNNELTYKDKYKITYYLKKAIDHLPALYKIHKRGIKELDEELIRRFTSIKNEIVDISMSIYFDKHVYLGIILTKIDNILNVLEKNKFELLEPATADKLITDEPFWQRHFIFEKIINIFLTEINKLRSYIVKIIILLIFLSILLIILKRLPILPNNHTTSVILSFIIQNLFRI